MYFKVLLYIIYALIKDLRWVDWARSLGKSANIDFDSYWLIFLNGTKLSLVFIFALGNWMNDLRIFLTILWSFSYYYSTGYYLLDSLFSNIFLEFRTSSFVWNNLGVVTPRLGNRFRLLLRVWLNPVLFIIIKLLFILFQFVIIDWDNTNALDS